MATIKQVYKPSLKKAGIALIKSHRAAGSETVPSQSGTASQSLAKLMNSGRRPSLGTTIQAASQHKSASQIYQDRRVEKARHKANREAIAKSDLDPKVIDAPVPYKRDYLSKNAGSYGQLIVDNPRLKVYDQGGGWARVVYTGPTAGEPVVFSIRKKLINDAIARPNGLFYNKAEGVYSKWINETKAGAMYTHRRQVEGMLKVAIRKSASDPEYAAMVDKLQKLLKKSDAEIAAWHQKWLDEHSKVEKEEFYDYTDVVGDITAYSEAWL